MCLGCDVGTANLVVCQRDENNNFVYKTAVNAFIEIPIKENRFVFNMMKDAGVFLIERKDDGIAYALGEEAVQMAYTMPQIELRRPMKSGCLNPSERSAQQIMNIMLHSLLDGVKQPNETLYYSIPANAINEETDADYHGKVVEAMLKSYRDEEKYVNPHPINEALALVYSEERVKHHTAVGISAGGGMVNVCYAIFGNPVFQFSLVNSGDYIDKMAAKASGESITFVNREKLKLNLNENSNSLVQQALKTQYQIMIEKTVQGIKTGLLKLGNKAMGSDPIDFVISGGTATPEGFEILFKQAVENIGLPVKLGEIIKPKDTLVGVSRGALLAAEAADKA